MPIKDLEKRKEYNRAYMKEWRKNNRDKVLEEKKSYKQRNKDKIRLKEKKQRKNLGDRYVKRLLKKSKKKFEITEELLSLRKTRIVIKRIKKVINEKQN